MSQMTLPNAVDPEELDEALVEPPTSARDERGQATTEYALVLLGAALIAVLLITWATAGGGAGKIGNLLDSVIDAITSHI